MSVSQTTLESQLKSELDAEYVSVTDTSGGCGQNFEVVIVSEMFAGQSTLQRHRLVNNKVKSLISQLHAFSQKTFTPAEWAKRQAA
ncbi:bola protein [Thamnocephalis sphaerospora]|uniref:Bola protein n=1 Tax=Thamnocephalis sphaerospora TaxID=78915 RepID=A0A4P9XJJ0_9FUNG|nr:bola protein [Thamnocephalis sphaerospora]|eukprot:RKP05928.1 bola protein [Thamnocephalis sphaerospora]